MTFEYMKVVQSMDLIEISDIGNTCINAINDDAEEWYIIIETKEGWTKVTQFGPLKIDSNNPMLHYFSYNYFEREYNDKFVYNNINKFINEPKHKITQVFEVEKETAKERLETVKRSL